LKRHVSAKFPKIKPLHRPEKRHDEKQSTKKNGR